MGNRIKDITGTRFGKLTAIKPTDKKCHGAIIWECKCDCGKITYSGVNLLTSGTKRSCGCLPVGNYRDITGERFGKLIAIKPTDRRCYRTTVWECKCDCGKITYVDVTRLTSGHARSCGCLPVGNYRDITGERFGKLTVIKPIDRKYHGNTIWECKCDCGKITYINVNHLMSGNTRSCGCLRGNYKDLTGERFGRLIVLKDTGERKSKSVIWECKCDCGEITYVNTHTLRAGLKISCGCAKRKHGNIIKKTKEKVIKIDKGRKIRDITGERFGKLTAIKPTDRKYCRNTVWECLCDCGKITYSPVIHLTKGTKRSCGCLPIGNYRDITGKRFGRLIALKVTEERHNGSVVWECLCDCGETIKVSSSSLIQGTTRSCGCLQKETGFIYNSVDITGQRYGKLIAVKPTEKRVGTNIVWECICDCGKITYANTGELKTGDRISCGCAKEKTRKKGTRNTSGVVGVFFSKNQGKWTATIGVKYKNYYLGQYKTFDEAIKARQIAEEPHDEPFSEWYKSFRNIY